MTVSAAPSLCSSKAEPSVDNGQTGVRYPAERPFYFFIAGWRSQSARLPEEEKVLVQIQFHDSDRHALINEIEKIQLV